MIPVIAALGAVLVLGGLLLAVDGLRPRPLRASPVGSTLVPRALRRFAEPGRVSPRTRLLLAGGAVLGVVVWVLTGWVIAVLVIPAAAAGIPYLLATAPEAANITRLDAMQEWTRNLSGVLTVGTSLETALIATSRATPDAIRPEVSTLVARLRAGWSTQAALTAFADDLDDATGDLIVYTLRLGAAHRGGGLATVLDGLAATVADDVRMRRAIEADREKPRATARWVTLIATGAMVALALFRSSYISSYRTGLGQAILLLLLGAYVACLIWLRRTAAGTKLPRFIGAAAARSRS